MDRAAHPASKVRDSAPHVVRRPHPRLNPVRRAGRCGPRRRATCPLLSRRRLVRLTPRQAWLRRPSPCRPPHRRQCRGSHVARYQEWTTDPALTAATAAWNFRIPLAAAPHAARPTQAPIFVQECWVRATGSRVGFPRSLPDPQTLAACDFTVADTQERDGWSVRGKPRIRAAGKASFTRGVAAIVVSMDGSFAWSRRAERRVFVCVATPAGDARSNTVVARSR